MRVRIAAEVDGVAIAPSVAEVVPDTHDLGTWIAWIAVIFHEHEVTNLRPLLGKPRNIVRNVIQFVFSVQRMRQEVARSAIADVRNRGAEIRQEPSAKPAWACPWGQATAPTRIHCRGRMLA